MSKKHKLYTDVFKYLRKSGITYVLVSSIDGFYTQIDAFTSDDNPDRLTAYANEHVDSSVGVVSLETYMMWINQYSLPTSKYILDLRGEK